MSKRVVILFDLDGTLLDSTQAILLSFRDSYSDFNLKAPQDKSIKLLIGHPLEYMYRALGIKEEMIGSFVDRYKFHYRKRSKPMTSFLPNAEDAIKEAYKFARLGIVTTKTGSYSKDLLEHMGVMNYFDVLIGREDVKNPKPHPEPILKALYQMNVTNRNSVWMIGDTCLDMVSGSDAGVKTVGVSCGYENINKLKLCAKVIRNDTVKAVNYIKKVTKA